MLDNRHIISETDTVIDALARLNGLSGNVMTLLVVNNDNVMTGTLTDGDIRRAILSGVSLEAPIKNAMNKHFSAINGELVDVFAIKNIRNKGIKLLPHLDSQGHVKNIYDLTVTRNKLPLSAVLMAGGKGERLRPMTLETPKPLLEIGGKAIIDYNIEALVAVGIEDITVTIRYLADKIKNHFSTQVAGINVKCVEETEPMGTIGAVSLIERHEDGNTLVMNSDLLTTISFEDMYIKHLEENADITIAAIPYTVSVPYAILAVENNCVKSIEEKPTYSYYANAGIYIFSNKILNKVAPHGRTDATDLVEQAINEGCKVGYYPITGTWIDIGSPTDFRQAQDLMRHHKDMTK